MVYHDTFSLHHAIVDDDNLHNAIIMVVSIPCNSHKDNTPYNNNKL